MIRTNKETIILVSFPFHVKKIQLFGITYDLCIQIKKSA
uniref:Uncharacterized protein n=1 Tax=Anguilla anguilla TaxID=7936 RepID=A0A0E9WLY7_ANGAN